MDLSENIERSHLIFSIPLRFTLNIILRVGEMKEIIFPILEVSSGLNLVLGKHHLLLSVCVCVHFKDDAISFQDAVRNKGSLDGRWNLIIRHLIYKRHFVGICPICKPLSELLLFFT